MIEVQAQDEVTGLGFDRPHHRTDEIDERLAGA
jgi:hypothetical protein